MERFIIRRQSVHRKGTEVPEFFAKGKYQLLISVSVQMFYDINIRDYLVTDFDDGISVSLVADHTYYLTEGPF